jgi:uncharacterized protein (TIGR02266 family)
MVEEEKKKDESTASEAIPEGKAKRAFARIPLMRMVKFSFPGLEDFSKAFSDNISSGGMFIKTERSIMVGTKIEFEIAISEEQATIKGSGEIVRVVSSAEVTDDDPYPGWGVRFHDLNDDNSQMLSSILKEMTQRA